MYIIDECIIVSLDLTWVRCVVQETRELQMQFDSYKDEMADVTETVEIATLDKEMAEEKVVKLVFSSHHVAY